MLVRSASILFLSSTLPVQGLTVGWTQDQDRADITQKQALPARPQSFLLETPATVLDQFRQNGVNLTGSLGETSFRDMLGIAPENSVLGSSLADPVQK